MASGNIVSQVTAEISGDVEGLRTQLRVAEGFIDRLQKRMTDTGKTSAASGQQIGTAFRAASSAVETLARTGTLAGASAKSAITQVAGALAPFLPGGAFIGAISIASLAIFHLLDRTREEAKRTAEEIKKAAADIERLRQGGDQPALIERVRTGQETLKERKAELAELNKLLVDADRVIKLARKIDTPFPDIGLTSVVAKAGFSEEIKARLELRKQIEADIKLREIELEIARKAALNVRDQLGRAPRGVTPIRVEVKGVKGSAEDAEREREALKNIEQGFADLIARAAEGKLELAAFDKSVRELGDAFESKLKTPTKDQSDAFAALNAQAAAVRVTLADLKLREAASEVEAFLVSMTSTAVDDLGLQLEALKKRLAELRKLGADPTTLANQEAVIAIQEQRIGNAIAEEATEERIKAILAQKESALARQLDLQSEINDRQNELATVTAGDEASLQRRASLLKQIEQLQDKIKDLGGEGAKSTGAAAVATQSWASKLADVANVLSGIATALGGANSEIARSLVGTAQLLAAYESIRAAIEAANKAKEAGNALSAGQFATSLLPGIGGAIAGGAAVLSTLKGLFGRDEASPAERRRQEILEENNQRLSELRDTLGEVIRLSVSGRDIANISRASFTRPTFDIGSGQPFPGGGGTFGERAATAAEIIASLRAAGTSLKELRQTAEDFGITLSESPTVEELKAVQEAVRNFSLRKLLDTFAGAKELLQAEFEIFDITDPIEQAQRFQEMLSRFSPAFREAIGGLDLTTREGREAASRAIEDFYKRAVESGELSAEEIEALFGGATPEEAIAAWREFEAAIDEATIAAAKFAEAISAVEAEFEIFDIDDPLEQFRRVGETFAELSSAFADFFEGVDVTTREGIEAAKARNRDLFERNRRGELSEEERGGLSQEDFEKRLLFVDQFLDDFLAGFDRAAAAARDRIFANARRDIELRDIEDPGEQFRSIAGALKVAFPAFAEILDQFDLSSTEGIKAFGDAIPGLIEGLEDGKIVIDGLAAEDIPGLIAALIGIESAGDAAEKALNSLADTLSRAFAEIDLDALIFGEDALTTARKKFEAAGFGAFDFGTQAGRDAAREAARDLARSGSEGAKQIAADLIRVLNALPELLSAAVGDGVALGAGIDGETTAIAEGAKTITEITANRMADYLRAMLELIRDIRNDVRGAFAGGLHFPAVTAPTVAPSIPFEFLRSGGGGTSIDLSVTIAAGAFGDLHFEIPSTAGNPQEVARAVLALLGGSLAKQLSDALLPHINRGLAREVMISARFAGTVL